MASEEEAPQTPVKGVKSYPTFDKSTTSFTFSVPFTPQSSPESPPEYIFSPPDSVHTAVTEDYEWDTPARKPASVPEHSPLQASNQSPLSQSKAKKQIFSSKTTVSKTEITSWLRSAPDISTINFDPSDNRKESNFKQVKEEPNAGLTLEYELPSWTFDQPDRGNESKITDPNELSNLREENDEPVEPSDPRVRPPKNFIPLDRVRTRRHSIDLGELGLNLQETKEEYRGRSRAHSEPSPRSTYLQGHSGLSPIADVFLHRVGPTIMVFSPSTPPDATPYVKAETPSSRPIASPATDGRVRDSSRGRPSTHLKRALPADAPKTEVTEAPAETGTTDTVRPRAAMRKTRSAENLIPQSGTSAAYSTFPDNQVLQGGTERAKNLVLFANLSTLTNRSQRESLETKRLRLEPEEKETQITLDPRRRDTYFMEEGESFRKGARPRRLTSVLPRLPNPCGSDSAEVDHKQGGEKPKEPRGRPRSKSYTIWQSGSNTTLPDGAAAKSEKPSPDGQSGETEDIQGPERSLAEILRLYIRHSLEENKKQCLGITTKGARCSHRHKPAPTLTINDPDNIVNGRAKEFTPYINLLRQSNLCGTHQNNSTSLSFWQRLLASKAANASDAQIKNSLALILEEIPRLVGDRKIVDGGKIERSAKEYILEIQTLKRYSPKYQQGIKLNELLERIITCPIDTVTEHVGQIYMYWHPGTFGHAKIGLSSRINERLTEWESQCKKKLSLHYPKQTDKGNVSHIYRVETLIHAELRDYRRQEVDCPRCHKTHKEWFDLDSVVTKDVAVEIIEKWMGWMRQRPYVQRPKRDGTGVEWVLKDDMRKTLKDVCRPHEKLSAIKQSVDTSLKEGNSDLDWNKIVPEEHF